MAWSCATLAPAAACHWHGGCNNQQRLGAESPGPKTVVFLKESKDMAVSAVNSSADMKMDYMKLLLAQMQNQNPLEPMSNTEMASQMAQFSQLEQLENMNTTFSSVLKNTQLNYANSLIGKRVVYEDSNGKLTGADVEAVGIEGSDILLKVGDTQVNVNDVLAIGQ
jgi:flagellar basal-body rod modification protein FlgD